MREFEDWSKFFFSIHKLSEESEQSLKPFLKLVKYLEYIALVKGISLSDMNISSDHNDLDVAKA